MPARGTATNRQLASDRQLAVGRLTASGRLNIDGSGGGGGGGDDFVQSQTVTRTAGDLTTTSTSFVDVGNGFSITMSTAAARCLIIVVAGAHCNTTGTMCLDIELDGTRIGNTDFGLVLETGAVTVNKQMCFSILTSVLTAASHQFDLQWRTTAGTFTLFASTAVSPLIFTVIETSLTA